MLFNSPEFALFFPIVTILYWVLAHRWRCYFLLAASCLFYMAFIPKYLTILIFIIFLDYGAGIIIEASNGFRRKLFLILSLIANIGVLAYFKYFNFFNDNLNQLANALNIPYGVESLHFILPIGLSFHTFQSMSYTIEVYRGNQGAERNFWVYALYVLFYPQLVAGPIERPQNLLGQFKTPQIFKYERVVRGLSLMLWGMFKKVVIADRLAIVVNHIYADPTQHQGLSLIIATYFFAFQIYCDFSGYSDIAIGAAETMGIKLMTNFRRPYFARNIPEFWGRWHISLSTWFRDYLYIPLGGNRTTPARRHRNVLIVFVVSGFWHGANWTYMVWGFIHGLATIATDATKPIRSAASRILHIGEIPRPVKTAFGILITFHCVVLAWIFFRAASLSDAWYILTHLFHKFQFLPYEQLNLGLEKHDFLLALALIVILKLVEGIKEFRPQFADLRILPAGARWLIYYILILAIAFLGKFDLQQFIYFQF